MASKPKIKPRLMWGPNVQDGSTTKRAAVKKARVVGRQETETEDVAMPNYNEVQAAIEKYMKPGWQYACEFAEQLLALAAEPAVCEMMAAVAYNRAGGDFDRLESVERESIMCDMGAALKALANECGG